jgi:hypothetical protein
LLRRLTTSGMARAFRAAVNLSVVMIDDMLQFLVALLMCCCQS